MLFQSLEFLIFFSLFFFVYWAVANKPVTRNVLLLSASIFLYSLWDVRFTALLCFIILVNFFFGKYVSKESKNGKAVFYSAIILNLIPLMFFKYFNFFIGNINDTAELFGISLDMGTLKLMMPVGISFYTFLSVSYLIDVYKKQIESENSLINYALSISYFPIIVSGPIHRPRIFLGQLKKETVFDYSMASEGLRQILTGLFYKVIIADNLAKHVNKAYGDYQTMDGFTLILGTVYFAFQLYFDFNGYSEMAIGVSKLLGFRIERNFKYPYLSRTISDFWKRWHISLTQWFRDYIFLPLSYIFSRHIRQDSVFNTDLFIYSAGILITWALTGFWHGAGWTFILWGMFHAVFLIINKGFLKTKKKLLKRAGLKKDSLTVIIYESVITFIMVNFAWIFFRSETSSEGFEILCRIFDVSGWRIPAVSVLPLALICVVLILEFLQREKEFLFEISGMKTFVRWTGYIAAVLAVLYFSGNDSSFIYMGF